MTSLYICESKRLFSTITSSSYIGFARKVVILFFLSHCISKLLNMKDKEIIKLLESSGIKANFICIDHNDRCNCHRIYDEAA